MPEIILFFCPTSFHRFHSQPTPFAPNILPNMFSLPTCIKIFPQRKIIPRPRPKEKYFFPVNEPKCGSNKCKKGKYQREKMGRERENRGQETQTGSNEFLFALKKKVRKVFFHFFISLSFFISLFPSLSSSFLFLSSFLSLLSFFFLQIFF